MATTMLFDDPTPKQALIEVFSGLHASPKTNNATGVLFAPLTVQDFTALFVYLTGKKIDDYFPAEFTQVATGLRITSAEAIRKEDPDPTRGLSLMFDDGTYSLEFAVVWTQPWHFYDAVKIQDSFVAFEILFSQEKKLSVSATIGSGKITFLTYDLDLDVSIQVPSFLVDARVKTDPDDASASAPPSGMAKDYLGSLNKPDAKENKSDTKDPIFIEEIHFSAAPYPQNYQLHLSVLNVLDCLHHKFRVDRFQADINYCGGSKETDYAIQAYTDIEIGFAKNPLIITLAGTLDKSGNTKSWAFAGSMALPPPMAPPCCMTHPVTVAQILNDLTSLFTEGANVLDNPYDLPDNLAKTTIDSLGLSFTVVNDTTKGRLKNNQAERVALRSPQ